MPRGEPDADALTAPVLSIQHFCLHDGPGIRSLVFFKGCLLRCAWCQNPESWKAAPELGCKTHLCIACQACVAVCPVGSLPGRVHRGTCRACFACVDVCPAEARVRFGTPRTVDDLLEELEPELPLLRSASGGVTLTGGEPLMHPRFARRLVDALHERGIHVAVETSGCHPTTAAADAEALLAAVDLVLFDVKLYDAMDHARYCGMRNDGIKETLRTAVARARAGGPRVWPRMPVVPGITTHGGNVAGWGELLASLGLRGLTLIPYHRLGDAKRDWVGLRAGDTMDEVSAEHLALVRQTLVSLGLTCYSPGDEDWAAPPS